LFEFFFFALLIIACCFFLAWFYRQPVFFSCVSHTSDCLVCRYCEDSAHLQIIFCQFDASSGLQWTLSAVGSEIHPNKHINYVDCWVEAVDWSGGKL